jgi:hypothetical protein
VNDVDLSARLHVLADELAGGGAVSADSAIALYRRRRRARAGLVAAVAAVVAIAVGVPTAIGSLTSSDGEVAVPSSPTTTGSPTPPTTTPAPAPAPGMPPPDSRPDPADEAELAQVAAGLPPLALGSPPEWDRWLPESKPYPGLDLEDDLSTCPVLSSRLETVVGQEMSYWTGTLPSGPFGCTWVEIPLSGQDNDYDYVISVGFLDDGTTVEEFRRYREGPGPGTHDCPSVDVPPVADGALLVRCTWPGTDASTATTTYTLVLPDTRLDGGLWILTAQSKDSTPVRPAEILPVLVAGVAAAFG